MGEENPPDSAIARARISLEGLSCGDAFGESFYFNSAGIPNSSSPTRKLPPSPWCFTDDTLMACSIVSVLHHHREIRQDVLAKSFADHYDSSRGYGAGMHRLLNRIREGEPWREAAASLFDGQGSFGNGSAMRVAPLGAFFSGNLIKVAEQAELSSSVTHTHPEAVSGAVAVAVAAALACEYRNSNPNSTPRPAEFLDRVLSFVPKSSVRAGIERARDLPPASSVQEAASLLGNGSDISAPDTVPFTLWAAAQHMNGYEEAMWSTAGAGGDMDTNCAIVGGIVVMYTGTEGIPKNWRAAREPLPQGLVGT